MSAVGAAEDGIRAGRVTGVQTCALPILRSKRSSGGFGHSREGHDLAVALDSPIRLLLRLMSLAVIALAVEVDGQFAFLTDLPLAHHHDRQIGRASCRERV